MERPPVKKTGQIFVAAIVLLGRIDKPVFAGPTVRTTIPAAAPSLRWSFTTTRSPAPAPQFSAAHVSPLRGNPADPGEYLRAVQACRFSPSRTIAPTDIWPVFFTGGLSIQDYRSMSQQWIVMTHNLDSVAAYCSYLLSGCEVPLQTFPQRRRAQYGSAGLATNLDVNRVLSLQLSGCGGHA